MADEIPTSEEILARRFVATQNSIRIVTGFQRYERPLYDYDRKFAPCRAACPTGHDIATGLFLLREGRPDLALELFEKDSPFPAVTGRVCYHPCEAACNRSDHDQPVAVNALERALAEYGGHGSVVPPPVSSPKTVGVIGAGPSGLSCAYHLRRMGYAVTVYDANERPGGVLEYGIPPYRLPRDVLHAELDRLLKLGIAFRLKTRVGETVPFAELQRRHDAVYVGVGLGKPRSLDLVSGDAAADIVSSGVEFLRRVATVPQPQTAGTVVVIGGGDVALDAARAARRLCHGRVILCALESRADMPAHSEEVEVALTEGIEIINNVAPRAIDCQPGGATVTLVRVTRVQRQPDGSMTWELTGSTLEPVRAGKVIIAIGQQPDCGFLPAECWSGNKVVVDETGQTPLAGVFAGGDLVGLYNVVNALASGKRAAVGIDCHLRTADAAAGLAAARIGPDGALSMAAYLRWREGEPPAASGNTQVRLADINLDYFPRTLRPPLPRLSQPFQPHSFAEVNLSLTREQAVAEAGRCFNCGICNMCGNCFLFCPDSSVVRRDDWGFEIDLDHCKGCGVCVEECPRAAMTMVPEYEVADESDQPND